TEALMQDNKALQAGTSHNLGQNFAKVFELQFQGRSGEIEFAWNTSWGVSTRLIGGLIMTHSDDDGLVVPPRLATVHAVIVPIYKNDEEKATVMAAADRIFADLKKAGVRMKLDDRDGMSPGAKYYEWELKGACLRIEIGPKDVSNNTVVVVPRVELAGEEAPKPGRKQKLFVDQAGLAERVHGLLDALQNQLLQNAIDRREKASHRGITSYDEVKRLIDEDAGFIYAGWCGMAECETKVKDETKATVRCIPSEEFRSPAKPEKCVVCGMDAKHEVVWSKAY
ncbi:MAG TPA: His/Gly/Thr/Pro-type tRNA ligase C-terminal domain-containing protein, partial [Candidatus Kapabacteria bacterium]|nr:His/Gly/Thr/Pro-type tRNA ligase C-terminal domain-containing protein [Candidatus Kapabacteria bacterium]